MAFPRNRKGEVREGGATITDRRSNERLCRGDASEARGGALAHPGVC